MIDKRYIERNKILKEMGFGSYKEYLQSDLWRKIRYEHLRKYPNCECCGKLASQVHHRVYNKAIFLKWNPTLLSVCRDCHEAGEFRDGEKVSMKVANERLKKIRKRNGLRRLKTR